MTKARINFERMYATLYAQHHQFMSALGNILADWNTAGVGQTAGDTIGEIERLYSDYITRE